LSGEAERPKGPAEATSEERVPPPAAPAPPLSTPAAATVVTAAAPAGDACYLLFSSNQRPQYEQDIIDVLAAPTGSPYTFRYMDRYIEDRVAAAPPPPGSRALVVFSIQQKARYHDPAYIPIRFGTVRSSTWYGGFLVIDFILGDACCAPITKDRRSPRSEREAAVRAAVVDFTGFVHGGFASPRDDKAKSLSLGVLPSERVRSGDGPEIFQDITEMLQKTTSFVTTRFLRFEKMTDRGTGEVIPCDESGHTVEAGKIYDLRFQQWQPREIVSVERFQVNVDGQNIKLVGPNTIEIGSMYDTVSLPVVATTSSTMERRYSLVAVEPIDPTPGVSGPRIKIPIIVTPPPGTKAAVTAASCAGAILLGLPALMPTLPMGLKVLAVGASALILAMLSAYGFRR